MSPLSDYILALDPAPARTAWVLYDPREQRILAHALEPNEEVLELARARGGWGCATLVIEMIASYGMPVGREVFETCAWIGRFIEAWRRDHALVYRRDVKLHLCGSARAKDKHVRQALLDRFPRAGGGKVPQIGTKAKPGPLYGIRADEWAALGVAVTYADNPTAYGPLGAARAEVSP